MKIDWEYIIGIVSGVVIAGILIGVIILVAKLINWI